MGDDEPCEHIDRDGGGLYASNAECIDRESSIESVNCIGALPPSDARTFALRFPRNSAWEDGRELPLEIARSTGAVPLLAAAPGGLWSHPAGRLSRLSYEATPHAALIVRINASRSSSSMLPIARACHDGRSCPIKRDT